MVSLIKDYQARWITAIALLAVIGLIGWIDNKFVMWLFLGILYIFSFYEAMKLYGIDKPSMYFWAATLWIISYFYPSPDDIFFVIAIVFAGSLAFFDNLDKRLLFPFLYPTIGFMFFFMLYNDLGVWWMIWLLVVVALTDVGAFFVGKTIGKHRFSNTSPNKTWEGVAGGVIIATIAGTIFAYKYYGVPVAFAITLLTSVASIFGDLFESYLKRNAGVKDSGNVLPGHGGVLDRVDGYLFGVIIMVVAHRFFA